MSTRARRVGTAIAAATMIGGAAIAVAPDAVATSGCQGVQVLRDGGHVTVQLRGADCQPVTVNVSTYDLPDTYSGSGQFDSTATPQTLRHNDRLDLVKSVKQTIILDLPACGWAQWDVYTGPVQDHVGPSGTAQLIAGAVTHEGATNCGGGGTSTSPTSSSTTSSTSSTTSTTTSPTESPTSSTTSSTSTSSTTSPTSSPTSSTTTPTSTTSTTSTTTSPTSTTTSPTATTSTTSTTSTTTSSTTSPTSSTTTSTSSPTSSTTTNTATNTASPTSSSTTSGGGSGGNGSSPSNGGYSHPYNQPYNQTSNLTPTSELAYTGTDIRPGLLLAVALIAIGGTIIAASRINIRRN